MENTGQGSCLCGSVSFEVIGTCQNFFICHCEFCQKDTGTAFAANLFYHGAQIRWLSGQESVKKFSLSHSRHVKSFCTNCGSALPSIENNGELVLIPAGCLDTPIKVDPNAHIFMKSKADWENKLADLKEFESFPN